MRDCRGWGVGQAWLAESAGLTWHGALDGSLGSEECDAEGGEGQGGRPRGHGGLEWQLLAGAEGRGGLVEELGAVAGRDGVDGHGQLGLRGWEGHVVDGQLRCAGGEAMTRQEGWAWRQ